MHSILKQKIIGIDFSDYSIELLCLEKGFFKPKVYAYSRCVLPPGVLSDGAIQHPAALSGILKKMMLSASPNFIKNGLCVFSLPDSQVFVHEFVMPITLGGKSLRQAILHEVRTKFPMKFDNLYYDFIVSGKSHDTQNILFFAAPDYIIEKYVRTLLDAGLTALAIDVESMSIGRSLLNAHDKRKDVLIADIGSRYTNITVYNNYDISGIHIIKEGGEKITKRISDELCISEEEAEGLKSKIGLSFFGDELAVSEIIADDMKEVIREIKGIIQYYLHRKKITIDSIVLTGGCALAPGIQKFFQSHFWQEVEIRNPLDKLRVQKDDLKNGRKVLFSNVIGLALRGLHTYPHLHGVNLLQKARSRL